MHGRRARSQDERWTYCVTEYCSGGDLYSLLARQPYSRLPEAAVRFYCAELCVALQVRARHR
jgi:serine/threonine protein kinase